ncbi:cytochrome-c peroxidase [Nitrincola sp. MINF-07-Sa-05]|uniref:cytochrome-c peroxidase n=1 Tax=Nitrincola salilacus TaxID=3400273 RepID=UPI0039180AB1
MITLLHPVTSNAETMEELQPEKALLGQMLFFDTNLSRERTQSCATCHSPANGFIDSRGTGTKAAVSLGDDSVSLGDRNTPTAAYAAFTPPFHLNKKGIFAGGFFWDGRANTLLDQAKGPPLNPIEMNMPSEQAILDRLLENPEYLSRFPVLYGDTVFDDATQAYNAMADAIAQFEMTMLFAPFDSKYDRHLRGEYELTTEEELGMTLFFSQQFTNCNLCHQLKPLPGSTEELFTNFEFHNIGVPENRALRAITGVTARDEGLFAHPDINDTTQKGKFKTPSLRNIAVTGPYMHNGVFTDLLTVIRFYNKYNSRSASAQVNPETGLTWEPPEIAENLSLEALQTGPALDERRMQALVAFLKTLTDQRYEHLLK